MASRIIDRDLRSSVRPTSEGAMTRLHQFARTVAVALLVAAVAAPSAVAAPVSGSASRVIVILAPYLSWSDVSAKEMPRTWELAESGAVGDINARSRTRVAGEPPSPLEGALTISAGSWAVPDFGAVAAFSSDEPYEYGTAGEAYERITGRNTEGRSIVYLGIPVTERKNRARSADITLGVLGQTIEDAGGVTAALGNSDVGYLTGEQRRVRPAALAAMNAGGAVRLGDVSQDLLREDPDAPFGIRTDLAAFETGVDELFAATADLDVPSLVVLDAGDTYRAVKFSSQVADEVAREQYVNSLHTLDAVVGYALERMGPDDVVVVASQSSQNSAGYEGLGPVVVAGAGFEGMLSSSSTHRPGIVTALDVTATVVDVLGLDRPVSVLGNAMTTTPDARDLSDRIADLVTDNATAVAIDSSKPGVLRAYIAVTVLALVAATLVLLRNHSLKPSKGMAAFLVGLKMVLIGVLSFPLASFAMFVFVPRPRTGAVAVFALLAVTLAVWAVAEVLRRALGTRISLAVLALGISALLLVDQWLGAPLSFSAYLGYSPLLAARFYGIGNEGAALLFGASLVGFAALLDEIRGTRAHGLVVNGVFPVFSVVSTVTMAAPVWGANVGVAGWGVVGYGLAWLLFSGRKVTWKTVALAGGAVVVLLAAFIAVDLMGSGPQTHLARSLESAREGGVVELWNIVARKAQTNLRVLTHTNWSFVLIAVLVFLGAMRLKPAGDFAATLEENPALGAAITAGLVSGVFAYFTEDSGIVIPALMFLYIGVGIVWCMLARLADMRPSQER